LGTDLFSLRRTRSNLRSHSKMLPIDARMPLKMRRLLFVDEDSVSSQSFGELVRGWGYQVDVAASGKQALDSAARTQYAAIVTEAALPDMDSGELVLQLSRLEPAPLLIMTTQRTEVSSRVQW